MVVIMPRPHRRQARDHGGAELRDAARLMIDPVALFERSFEVAEAYENWLAAQAELFLSLYWFSVASLEFFRALSGKQTALAKGPAHERHARPLAPPRHGRHLPPAAPRH